jgi:hypothetical protein
MERTLTYFWAKKILTDKFKDLCGQYVFRVTVFWKHYPCGSVALVLGKISFVQSFGTFLRVVWQSAFGHSYEYLNNGGIVELS